MVKSNPAGFADRSGASRSPYWNHFAAARSCNDIETRHKRSIRFERHARERTLVPWTSSFGSDPTADVQVGDPHTPTTTAERSPSGSASACFSTAAPDRPGHVP